MKPLFFLILLIFTSNNSFCGWDLELGFNGGTLGTISFVPVSIPFEGLNNIFNYNRTGLIYSGIIHRRYDQNYPGLNLTDYTINPIYYETNPSYCQGFSTWYEVPETNQWCYGFAKYLVTFTPSVNPSKKIQFYMNFLDSELGRDDIPDPDIHYHCDLFITYYYNGGVDPYIDVHSFNRPLKHRYVNLNEQYKEITIWDWFYNRSEPWDTDFHVKTTPFPITPEYLQDNKLRNFSIGTNVTFDGVLEPYELNNNSREGYNSHNGPIYTYYIQPPIPVNINSNDRSNNYCTPAWFYNTPTGDVFGVRITAETNNHIVIKNDKKLWISGFNLNPNNKGDTLIFQNGSYLTKESNAQINTCNGGCLSDSGAITEWAAGSFHKAWANSEIGYYGNNIEHTVNNGGHIEIMPNATLKVGDNTTLTIEGESAWLTLNPGSNVYLGNNAKIQIKNGAGIFADGCTFERYGSNNFGYGIVLENPCGSNDIKNCTFNNVKRPVSGKNIFGLLLQNNTINLPSVSNESCIGVLIQNFNGSGSGSLNFNHNIINNGYIGIFLGGYASNDVNAIIQYNTITSTNSGWTLALRKVSGSLTRIENNTLVSNNNYAAMGLWMCNPNLYNNYVENNCTQSNSGISCYLVASNPNLVPTSTQGENQGQYHLMWNGGSNEFKSNNSDNFHLQSSKPVIDYGQNDFRITNSTHYHFYGLLGEDPTQPIPPYYGRNNCWYGNNYTAKDWIYYTVYYPPEQCSTIVVSINTTGSNNQCNEQINYSGYSVFNIGDYYDTVYTSDEYRDSAISDDAAIYANATLKCLNSEYVESITSLKDLLDNYGSSQYKYISVSDLYSNYERLDTSDQSHRDFIFSELKNYFNAKITQYQNDLNFVDIAYNYVLMCEARIRNYNDALTGYEFISLYHPDPEQRLLASMDYGYIQELLNGAGGKGSQYKSNNEVKILKLMDKNPIGKILKNTYEKMEKQNKYASKTETKSMVFKSDIRTKELIDRVKYNINTAVSLNSQQRDERRMEDIKLLVKYDPVENNNFSVIPKLFSLSQNYPNPFNPITKIQYSLPKDAKVKLIVYDILGREVARLLNNELIKSGSHTVEFNGSNLASGIYLYRLETDGFSETKKMVLVK